MTGTFQDLYREHVVPKLRNLCWVQGTRIALGYSDFTDAFGFVYREAIRSGSCHLPRRLEIELEEHILAWLAEEAFAASETMNRLDDEMKAAAKTLSLETVPGCI